MADDKAAAPAGGDGGKAPEKAQKPTMLIAVLVINMLVMAGMGVMFWMGKKKEAAQPGLDAVARGELEAQKADAKEEEDLSAQKKLVKLEPFVVNMAGSRGRRLARVTMELDVENQNVETEIVQRQAQIRDIIIIILSSKTFDSVSSKEGKESLREEIRETVSGFLKNGKIVRVYFTEFIYN